MANDHGSFDPSTWDPALDAVTAAPDHHKVLFENDRLRVLEVPSNRMTRSPSITIAGLPCSCSTQ